MDLMKTSVSHILVTTLRHDAQTALCPKHIYLQRKKNSKINQWNFKFITSQKAVKINSSIFVTGWIMYISRTWVLWTEIRESKTQDSHFYHTRFSRCLEDESGKFGRTQKQECHLKKQNPELIAQSYMHISLYANIQWWQGGVWW